MLPSNWLSSGPYGTMYSTSEQYNACTFHSSFVWSSTSFSVHECVLILQESEFWVAFFQFYYCGFIPLMWIHFSSLNSLKIFSKGYKKTFSSIFEELILSAFILNVLTCLGECFIRYFLMVIRHFSSILAKFNSSLLTKNFVYSFFNFMFVKWFLQYCNYDSLISLGFTISFPDTGWIKTIGSIGMFFYTGLIGST